MDFEYPPYVVDRSEHSARLFRVQLQQDRGEGSGVSRAPHLRLMPLNVPGAGFRVAPGGGVAQSRDTTASADESYGPYARKEITVTGVTGTGSGGGRRDLVILEITDPSMESVAYPAPSDPEFTGGWLEGDTFQRITVIQDVDSMVPAAQRPVKDLAQITTGPYAHVTGITLGAINWPASTGTITDGMIEDLRKVQNPRTSRRLVVAFPTGTAGLETPNGVYGSWPLVGAERPMVDVPTWAKRMTIVCTIGAARFHPGASGPTAAGLRTGFGTSTPGEHTVLVEDADSTAGRGTYTVMGTHAVPDDHRGTRQPIDIQAARSLGTGGWFADYQTSVAIDYEFSEEI